GAARGAVIVSDGAVDTNTRRSQIDGCPSVVRKRRGAVVTGRRRHGNNPRQREAGWIKGRRVVVRTVVAGCGDVEDVDGSGVAERLLESRGDGSRAPAVAGE